MRQLVILPSACQETHNRFIVPVNKSFRSSHTYYSIMQWEPPDPCAASSPPPEACKHRARAAGAPPLCWLPVYSPWMCFWSLSTFSEQPGRLGGTQTMSEAQTVWCRGSSAARTWGFHRCGPTQAARRVHTLKCNFTAAEKRQIIDRVTSDTECRSADFTLELKLRLLNLIPNGPKQKLVADLILGSSDKCLFFIKCLWHRL